MNRPHTPLPSDLEVALATLIGENLFDPAEPVTAHTDLFERGLDSMGIMQLAILLEEKWGAAISPEDFTEEHFKTPAALAAFMRQRAETPQ